MFYFGLLLYFIWSGFAQPWFFTGASLIAAISFADDIKPHGYFGDMHPLISVIPTQFVA